MTQQSASDSDLSAVVSFDAQTRRPLSECQSGESWQHRQVQERHNNSKHDSGSLGRITRRASATAQHTSDKCAEDNQGDECDVVD